MTTETDKLVEMARERGAFYSAARGWLTFRPDMLADFRAAIIADLAADVEPVAFTSAYSLQRLAAGYDATVYPEPFGLELSTEMQGNQSLYPASTVAALKARVAELEAVLERIANPIPYEQANVPEGCKLNGHALLAQLDRPEYYQSVARSVLKG